MGVSHYSIDELYSNVMRMIEDSRKEIHSSSIDLSGMGEGVEAYCDAVAALPSEAGRKHQENLTTLMQAISTLGDELLLERNAVYEEIQSLESVRKAHNAYQKTRAIKGEFDPSQNES